MKKGDTLPGSGLGEQARGYACGGERRVRLGTGGGVRAGAGGEPGKGQRVWGRVIWWCAGSFASWGMVGY
ncbi:MAG: hypothetical protein N2595_07120 [bacterium]|nr:hypothetical protein [bacterium]